MRLFFASGVGLIAFFLFASPLFFESSWSTVDLINLKNGDRKKVSIRWFIKYVEHEENLLNAKMGYVPEGNDIWCKVSSQNRYGPLQEIGAGVASDASIQFSEFLIEIETRLLFGEDLVEIKRSYREFMISTRDLF